MKRDGVEQVLIETLERLTEEDVITLQQAKLIEEHINTYMKDMDEFDKFRLFLESLFLEMLDTHFGVDKV